MSAGWLIERLNEWNGDEAFVWRGASFDYGWVRDNVSAWQAELKRLGVAPGSVVALEADYSPRACTLLLALIDNGNIVVPLTSAVASQKEEFRSIAQVEALFAFGRDDSWSFEERESEVDHPLHLELIDRGHPGLVLFSSGSTGKSKASLHDFVKILEKFKARRNRLRTLTFLLLDHIGGINTLFYTLSNGGAIVAVEGRSPEEICRAVESHRVQLLPTSPTFLNLLLISEAYRRFDLSSLELITYGTEPMPESTLGRLSEVFPSVRLQQTYGLSELGILRSKSRDSKSLWVKVGGEGFETKIVDGILWIRAASAMLGYLNAPSPFDEEGWFNTEDMVEADGDYIRILGRKTEIINVGGEKVYPSEVESVLLQMENVKDATVRGEPNHILGNIVAARLNLFEPEELPALKRRVREYCRERLPKHKMPQKIEVVEDGQYSARFKKLRSVGQA